MGPNDLDLPTSKPSPFWQDINQRWAGWQDALPFRVFEMAFTFSYLTWIGCHFMSWREWLTEEGFHLDAETYRILSYPDPFPLPPEWSVPLLFLLWVLSCLAVITNRWRRAGLWLCLVFAIYFQGVDYPTSSTVNKYFVVVYGLLALMPGFAQRGSQLLVPRCNIGILQATLLVTYFASGVSKAWNGDWLRYHDVLQTQMVGEYRTELAAWCLRALPDSLWTFAQYFVLVFELGAPLLLMVPHLRRLGILFGAALHLMIALLMKDLIYFTLVMWSFYTLFLSAQELGRLASLSARCWRKLSGLCHV